MKRHLFILAVMLVASALLLGAADAAQEDGGWLKGKFREKLQQRLADHPEPRVTARLSDKIT